MVWRYLIEGPWVIFVVYWTISALQTRRTVKRESFLARYGVLLMEILGFWLLFSDSAAIGVLGRQVVERTYALAITGVVLTWIGIATGLWARYHLGQYWSARITLKEDHKLIRTGPYAYLRHPIYSGLDLAVIGTALAIDRWRCFAGVAVIVMGYVIKAKREESLLAAQFGEEFAEHCRRAGFLIPRLP